VSNNTASDGFGGGIFAYASRGSLTVTNSTLMGNTADNGSGGISNYGTMTMTDSTVSGNWGYQGGGINNSGTLTLTNSTVTANAATHAGGISNLAGDTLTITNSTVSGNTATHTNGGILSFGPTTITSSTVSGNEAPEVTGITIGYDRGILTIGSTMVEGDCARERGAIITSEGYNLESPGNTCGFDHGTDLVNITEGQLDLEPLADNGGPTKTHALGAGSVAIDHIPVVDCEVDEDQRGEPRPGGSMCDVGAFEVQP